MGGVLEADSAFGKAWASVFVVFGVVALLGAVSSARPVEPGSAGVRRTAVLSLLLLAGWAAVVGVLGALEEGWIWPVVMALPTAYLLWALVRLLRTPTTTR